MIKPTTQKGKEMYVNTWAMRRMYEVSSAQRRYLLTQLDL